jgi:hypothetical protein
MKKTFTLAVVILVAASLSFGGVVRATKSEITFKKFGTFSVDMTEKLSPDKRISNQNGNFKGKGLLGGLIKAFFPTGQIGELTDLPAGTITQIDHKRKEYTTNSIEKWVADRDAALKSQKENQPQTTESDIKIVKSEFKVEETSESQVVNNFPCKKYIARWIVDWENVKTGNKGTDRLETVIWTTPTNDALKSAQAEEMAFSTAYLKAMGLDMDQFQRDALGMQWIMILGSLDPTGGGMKLDPKAAGVDREMKKIGGYPIVVDGKYYPMPKITAAEQKEEPADVGIGGALGKIGAGLLKKKPNPEEENAPVLAFYTEVKSIQVAALDPTEFQVPAGYKKK